MNRPFVPNLSSTTARLAVSLAMLGAMGCALAIDARDYGDRCMFRGRDDECGACLTARCQPKIDACCLSNTCGGLIDRIERCATAHDADCDEIRKAAAGPDDARRELAICVSERCRGACERAPERSLSTCTETRFGYQGACVCEPATAATPANRYQCDEARFPGTRCCASSAWPSPGNQCSCTFVACLPSRDGCSCSLSDAFDPTAQRECGGEFCCQSTRSCRCGTQPCDSDETRVQACNAETTPCRAQSIPVTRCSLP